MSFILKKVWSGNLVGQCEIEHMGSLPQFLDMPEHHSCYLVEYYNPNYQWKFFWSIPGKIGQDGVFITNAMKEDPPRNGERYWNDAGDDKMVYSTTLTLSNSLTNDGQTFLYRQHFETWTGAFIGYLNEVDISSLPSIWVKTFEEDMPPKKTKNDLDLRMDAWEKSNAGDTCAGIGFIIQNILNDSGLNNTELGKNILHVYESLCVSSMDEILRKNIRLGQKPFAINANSDWIEKGHSVGSAVVNALGYKTEQEVLAFFFDSVRVLTEIDHTTSDDELKSLWSGCQLVWAVIAVKNLGEENKFYNIGYNIFLLYISHLLEISPETAENYTIPEYTADSFPERAEIFSWAVYAIQAVFVDFGFEIPSYENTFRHLSDTLTSDFVVDIGLNPDFNAIGAKYLSAQEL
jgi:hypothetical protein